MVGRGGGKRGGKNGRALPSPTVESMVTHLVQCEKFPPQFDAQPSYRRRQRWVSAENVAISGTFTIASGHYQFKVHNTTTAFTCYVDQWRIRRIWVWCINYVDNATTATLIPAGLDIDTNSFNDRDQAFTCSSRSEAMPGFMCIKPARDTPLGSWHRTSTVNSSGALFTLTVDNGGASSGNWATTTVDIEFEFVLSTIGVPLGYTGTTGATTVGVMSGSNLMSNSLLLQSINTVI
jgi:hypothetical protein